MVALTNLGLIPLLAGFSGLVITVYLFWSFERESAGTTRMREIAGCIQEGANAFIKREMKTISYFAVILTVILLENGW